PGRARATRAKPPPERAGRRRGGSGGRRLAPRGRGVTSAAMGPPPSPSLIPPRRGRVRRGARVLAALLVAFAVALGGCGSSSNSASAFKRGYQAERSVLVGVTARVSYLLQGGAGQSGVNLATQLDALGAQLQHVMAQMALLQAPPSLLANLNALLQAGGAMVSDLQGLAAAELARNPGREQTVGQALI